MFSWFKKTQRQSQSGQGVAIQAGQNITVNVQGITAGDARVIALDVFKANLLEFRGIAQNLALERGEAITDKFISKLQAENPDGIQQAQTPDFQDALFTVQKECAKANDEELGDLLVDLLVDRTKQQDRTILRLVLTESLHTAPKLTPGQISLLSVIFLLRYVRFPAAGNASMLSTLLNQHLLPVIGGIVQNPPAFQHLEFAGCGAVSMGSISIENIWRQTYPGLFKTGFNDARLENAQLSDHTKLRLIIPCLNDQSQKQVAAVNMEVLNAVLAEIGCPEEEKQRVKTLFQDSDMSDEVLRNKVLEGTPDLVAVLSSWNTSQMTNFNLTSVGMAIGHANIKRHVGEFAPLSIWIN